MNRTRKLGVISTYSSHTDDIIPVLGCGEKNSPTAEAAPGSTAITVALVRTDEEEAAARQRVASMGLIAGAGKNVEPDPTMRGVFEAIKRHNAGER